MCAPWRLADALCEGYITQLATKILVDDHYLRLDDRPGDSPGRPAPRRGPPDRHGPVALDRLLRAVDRPPGRPPRRRRGGPRHGRGGPARPDRGARGAPGWTPRRPLPLRAPASFAAGAGARGAAPDRDADAGERRIRPQDLRGDLPAGP